MAAQPCLGRNRAIFVSTMRVQSQMVMTFINSPVIYWRRRSPDDEAAAGHRLSPRSDISSRECAN
jgi:hypothetical protein